ncbi:hypothetical protein, partial [Crocosphaera watsonii]|uniref:hypothetical protein n=1 Tax=Crocosphaera watsonii TaxID=263511 RepID=UPI00065085CE
ANFYEGKTWNIEDGGQNYAVKVEGGIFTIYIPPTASQIAYNLVDAIRNLGSAIANYTTSTTNTAFAKFLVTITGVLAILLSS